MGGLVGVVVRVSWVGIWVGVGFRAGSGWIGGVGGSRGGGSWVAVESHQPSLLHGIRN